MHPQTQKRRQLATGGAWVEHFDGARQHYTPRSAEDIAAASGAKRTSDGRWRGRCPICDGKRDAFSVFECAGGGVSISCFRCGAGYQELLQAIGLWRERATTRTGPSIRDLTREAIRHGIAGTRPTRLPPFTRSVPRIGQVLVLCGGLDTWEARRRVGIGLILPPGHPPAAYRWPVSGRHARIIDLADAPRQTIGYDHPKDWRECPLCWIEDRRSWLAAWAVLMIRRDGASRVTAVSESGRADYGREVRHVA